jgi:hypothetical protein
MSRGLGSPVPVPATDTRLLGSLLAMTPDKFLVQSSILCVSKSPRGRSLFPCRRSGQDNGLLLGCLAISGNEICQGQRVPHTSSQHFLDEVHCLHLAECFNDPGLFCVNCPFVPRAILSYISVIVRTYLEQMASFP